jgi:hypothetical protein
MTTRPIYSPEGMAAPDQTAVRLTATPPLSGARIAVLDNGKAGADWLLGRLAEQLAQRAGADFVGAWRKGSAATPCEADLLETISREAQIVLTGTAD